MEKALILIDIHTHVPADNASGTFFQTFELKDDVLVLKNSVELSLGLHPWEIKNTLDENRIMFETIKDNLKNKKYLAIGETGFDRYFRKDLSLELQEEIFFWHYELACFYKLPLILHIVHAHDQFLKVLKKIQKPKTPMLIHDFRGGSEEIKKYLKYEDLHFSFGKSLFSSDGKSLERFMTLPVSRVHLETDGDPDVSILKVYQKAVLKVDGDFERLAHVMQNNARDLFGIDFN